MAKMSMKERNQEIVRMRKEGYSYESIASMYNLTKQRVQQIYARETGTSKPTKKTKATKPQEKRMDISTFSVTKEQREKIQQQAERVGEPVRIVVDAIILDALSGEYTHLFHKKKKESEQVAMTGDRILLNALRVFLEDYEETPSEALRIVIDKLYEDEDSQEDTAVEEEAKSSKPQKNNNLSSFLVTKTQKEGIVNEAYKTRSSVTSTVNNIVSDAVAGVYDDLFHEKQDADEYARMNVSKDLLQKLRLHLENFEETPSEALRLIMDKLYG